MAMEQFPSEFAALLSSKGLRLLAGDCSLLPLKLSEERNHFFVLEGVVDPEISSDCLHLFERHSTRWLQPIRAKLDPTWITGMTRNFSEVLGKTMNVDSVIFRDPSSETCQAASEIGLLPMLHSESLRRFAEAVTGFRLEGGWGSQVICYRHGHYVGPHNDHHPEFDWAKEGYIDIQLVFANDACSHQWFVHERDSLLSEVWNINLTGAVTVFRQPFWHYTTPLIGKPGREVDARRWVVGQVFRILKNVSGKVQPAQSDTDSSSDGTSNQLPLRQLEDPCPLSRSLLYKCQRRFYSELGSSAWSDEIVPSRVTTSPFIASAYCKFVLDLMTRDHSACNAKSNEKQRPFDSNQPAFIVELGAGSGRLAYLFLRRWQDVSRRFSVQVPQLRYVMTDFAERNVRAWMSNTHLRPFIESGNLDFAIHDVEQDRPLRLLHSGTTLSSSSFHNPVLVFANYFFDSIPHDVFRVERRKLLEGLVTLSARCGEQQEMSNPSLLQEMQVTFGYRAASLPYYGDSDCDDLLREYQARLDNSTFLFPVGPLKCLKYLTKLAGDSFILLTADKGHFTEAELRLGGDPVLARHGSFSVMANMHALISYTQSQGGFCAYSLGGRAGLGLAALFFGVSDLDTPKTRHSFQDVLGTFGPLDCQELLGAIAQDQPGMTLGQVLALLRLTEFDPYVLCRLASVLRREVKQLPEWRIRELTEALDRVWENHYPVGEGIDPAFEIGTVLQVMELPDQAAKYYQLSLAEHGDHYSTLHNLGLCNFDLHRPAEALRYFEGSMSLNPAFEQAAVWRQKSAAALRGKTPLTK